VPDPDALTAGQARGRSPSLTRLGYRRRVTDFETPSGLVFASTQIMYEGWPILNVTHDADDEHWQFINGWVTLRRG
jgi:hypothetical protein